MKNMFKSLNRQKLLLIVLLSTVLMTFLITFQLINERKVGFKLKNTTNKATKLKPKIFCMITTQQQNHITKAIHVKNTWAKRCDQFLFLSSANDTDLPAISLCNNDDRSHLWCKVWTQSLIFALISKLNKTFSEFIDKERLSLYLRQLYQSI